MMTRRETKHLKALYFDLRIKDLKEHYSQTNPKGAYALIQRFLTSHNFSHEQYSGYNSIRIELKHIRKMLKLKLSPYRQPAVAGSNPASSSKTRRNLDISAGFCNFFSELNLLDMQERMYYNSHRRKPKSAAFR